MPARGGPAPNKDTLPLGQAPGCRLWYAWLLPRLADRHCGGGSGSPLASARICSATISSCHNPDKTKGDLDLTQRQTAQVGGDQGPAFAEGNPGESRLIQFLKPDSDPHMPPKKQLSDDHIATLSQWITAGAVWLPEELDVKKQAATAEELGDLPGGYRPVFALALSPDDQRLAAGHGNEVIIHGVGEKKSSRLAKLAGHRDVVQSIAWPDAVTATGGYRKVILEHRRLDPAGELNGLPGRVSALALRRQPVAHHR